MCLSSSSNTKIDHRHVIAYMRSCSVSDEWYMLASVRLSAHYSADDFLLFWLQSKVYLTTTVLMRPWQLLIRAICSHLVHDGQQWSSDLLLLLLFPSRPLSSWMEVTSRQASRLMYSLSFGKVRGGGQSIFFFFLVWKRSRAWEM